MVESLIGIVGIEKSIKMMEGHEFMGFFDFCSNQWSLPAAQVNMLPWSSNYYCMNKMSMMITRMDYEFLVNVRLTIKLSY